MTKKVTTLKTSNWARSHSRYSSLVFGLWFPVVGLILLSSCVPLYKSQKASKLGPASAAGVEVDEKKAELLKQIDRKFENPDAHFQLGQLYHADRMWSQAEYHYSIALSFVPANSYAQAAMVKLLVDSGNPAKARRFADNYVRQVSGSANKSLQLAAAFHKQQLDEYALACYQQAVRLAPNSAEANKLLGYYYLGKGDEDHARRYLSRSFQLNPNQLDVAGELGRLGVEIKRP